MRPIIQLILLSLLLLMAAPALAGTPSGYWSGTWSSSTYPGARGSITVDITMTGTNVTGTISIGNTECGTLSAPVSGSVSDSTITLNATFSGCGNQFPFTIVIPSSMGSSEVGNYAIYLQNGSVYDLGSWVLYRQTPATVTFTASCTTGGTISPSGNVTIDYKGSQTFVVTPADGYKIQDVKITTASSGGGLSSSVPTDGLSAATYNFFSTYYNTSIHAIFESLPEPPQPSGSANLAPILQLLLLNEPDTFKAEVANIISAKGYDNSYIMQTTWSSPNSAPHIWHFAGELPAAGWIGSNRIQLTGTDPVENKDYQFTVDAHGRNWQGYSGMVVLYEDNACTIPIGYYEWTVPTGILNSISFGNLNMRKQ